MPKDFSILYVDDEPQNLISFRATFRREYTIFTAVGGAEGLDILRKERIDLIITDQRMPVMTGVQFLEKTLEEYPDIIRMVLTGFSDMEAIIDVINSGRIFRYITKPWDESELRMTIENARQISQLRIGNKRLLSQLQSKVEEQERTLKLFMRYVPQAVVERALDESTESMLEGEQLEIAVLFCDIRGFTPMSEELSPREVVAFLNDYYAMMTEVVKRHRGTVNQFVGDEIFACFGAPIATTSNERHAVLCALEMMEKRAQLNEKYRDRVGREIEMGIGINSGEAVAGNLGSEDQISYSVTGDTVNTGKRIETLTKEHPNSILISQPVYDKVSDLIEAKAWDPIEVKGKRSKIQVYEVMGRNGQGS
ncbi:adenylate/guanylate cyclase domain-containing protein [Pontibacter sp. G13]|uniref:adenylate/guanylate cyclase domain-containing protein n=1 Tax=Pontibacter sp. G13 TaxID=3074898 RepID=UPI00288A8AFD|nr:adenylate/guanylate cyclase domain-containing protein [Pontibacter sp. G13]WNJ20835.1 adenylate/guanylate cyclase domain-containing protein [Pontibacter sp. G13]